MAERTAQTTQAASGNRPVFVVFGDRSAADRLCDSLRDFGFRARPFVNLAVASNASGDTPPAAVVVDQSLLRDDDGDAAASAPAFARPEGPRPWLLVVGREDGLANRLDAIRSGGDAWLTWPFNPTVLAQRLQQLLNAPALTDQPRVLLVDDRDRLAEPAAALTERGMRVQQSDDPGSLLGELERDPPDVLLVSGELASVDARDLLRVVRQEPRFYGIPALVLAESDRHRFDGLAAEAGIDAVVGLPAPGEDLAAMVAGRLQRVAGLAATAKALARWDPDTGLDSPDHLRDELRQALARVRDADRRAALLHVEAESADVPAGRDRRLDRALTVAVTRRLRQGLPPTSVVARLAPGRYAALIHDAGDAELQALTTRLQQALDQQAPATRGRLGLTLLRADLAGVDSALERARQATGHTDETATGETQAAPPDDQQWQPVLRQALDHGRFRLVYQPIASLSGNPVSLYEGFVRLLDADGAEVLPQEFLPAARRLRLATELDRCIVTRALEVLAGQLRQGHRPLLFLKLFPETVTDPQFTPWLAARLQDNDLPGSCLVFQITQETATQRLTEAAALAEGLAPLGCHLALEHFGAGDADQPAVLERLRPTYIKLSPVLTEGLENDKDKQQRVQAITSEAREHGVRTIAALVQDATVLSALWAAGVNYIQGYFMQPPSNLFGDPPA